MKNRINQLLFKLIKKFLSKRFVHSNNRLTPKYLFSNGWIEKDGYYFEPNIKDRDRISITFEHHFYRVWHSDKLTFIALESTLEWFELYYLMSHPDNGRYDNI